MRNKNRYFWFKTKGEVREISEDKFYRNLKHNNICIGNTTQVVRVTNKEISFHKTSSSYIDIGQLVDMINILNLKGVDKKNVVKSN